MNILDPISESQETIFWVEILKFFDAEPDPGMFLTLDPGWKKFGSGIQDGIKSDLGSRINIPDPQHYFLTVYLPCLSGVLGTDMKNFLLAGLLTKL